MSSVTIHPSAVVAPGAELGQGVSIGAYAVIGEGVVLGDRTSVGNHATVEGPAVFGQDNRIFPHAALGFEPQDLKYRGEPTRLVVGSRNVFREFSTVQRGKTMMTPMPSSGTRPTDGLAPHHRVRGRYQSARQFAMKSTQFGPSSSRKRRALVRVEREDSSRQGPV